jgi:signal transduction histidine kinase
MQTESSCRRTLARSLYGWIAACIIVVAAGLAVGAAIIQKRAALSALHAQARYLAETLSGDPIRTGLWNLDRPAVQRYLDRAPLDRDAVFVRVLNQFGEVLAERSLDGGAHVIVERQEVHHGAENIGFVEVGFSTREIDRLVRFLIIYALAVALCGTAALAGIVWIAVHTMVRVPLRRLTEELKRIADGDFEQQLPASPYREIDEINGEVNTMGQIIALRTRQLEAEVRERRGAEAEVRSLALNLNAQVTERTAELTLANRRLAEEIRERRIAQDEILAVSAHEQRRIGIDLHDSLGQELTGAAFLSEALAKSLRRSASDLATRAEQIAAILLGAVVETRRIARGLTPVETSGGGLVAALRGLCHSTAERFGIDCDLVESGGPVQHASAADASHLYRIAQEAVNNAIRHGQARRITVSLRENSPSGCGRLAVIDDGSGIPVDLGPAAGMGMRTMRYRAEALNGRLDVTSNASGGTTVVVEYALAAKPGAGPQSSDGTEQTVSSEQ